MQPTCNIAFKEWAAVCVALADGRQTISLRKGGIHEEFQGFRIAAHQGFWFYPTNFHQQAEDLTSDAGRYIERAAAIRPPPGQIGLRLFAELQWVTELTTVESALRLADRHIWSEATVRKRFAYKQPGLYLLGVRVFSLRTPILIRESAKMAGCRSWVTLPEPISTEELEPVLTDSLYWAQAKAIHAALA
jgi:hypothetical protein